MKICGEYENWCVKPDGTERWRDRAPNKLTDEGCIALLELFLRGGAAPSGFFVGALLATAGANEAAVPASSTLAGLVANYELSAAGYARATGAVARNTTDWTLATKTFTSKELSWSVDGDWPLIRFMFLATTADNSGKLVSLAQMPQDRLLYVGDTFRSIYRLYLQ